MTIIHLFAMDTPINCLCCILREGSLHGRIFVLKVSSCYAIPGHVGENKKPHWNVQLIVGTHYGGYQERGKGK